MGAAALFLAAAVTALLLKFMDRRLRTRRLADLPAVLPPLDAIEKVMFRLIGAGFVAAHPGVAHGLHLRHRSVRAQHLQHKTILSCIAWVIFGVLLFGRVRYGWRGRAAVTLDAERLRFPGRSSYFGSKFVLEYLLGRHWG